jgi:hypothetical protein
MNANQEGVMPGSSGEGSFSRSFLGLQLQLQTLLEEAGGNETANLLDRLSELSRAEQHIIINLFSRTVDRIVSQSVRLSSEEDHELHEFEEQLYQQVLSAFRRSAAINSRGLHVVDGAKDHRLKNVVNSNRSVRAQLKRCK